MSRSLIAPIALACSLLGATQANAADLAFTGFANGYQTVDVSLSAPNAPLAESVAAGGFAASLNGSASFTTYCIDLYEWIGFGPTYSEYSPSTGAAHVFANANANTDIGKLYAQANPVNDATSQAAFQIAVWEIAYETTGSYDLGTGAARFTGGTADSSGALALATSWLNAVPGTANTSFSLLTLESVGADGVVGHQDQVFAVPEPSTYALMAGGLLAIGFMARRRPSQPR